MLPRRTVLTGHDAQAKGQRAFPTASCPNEDKESQTTIGAGSVVSARGAEPGSGCHERSTSNV